MSEGMSAMNQLTETSTNIAENLNKSDDDMFQKPENPEAE